MKYAKVLVRKAALVAFVVGVSIMLIVLSAQLLPCMVSAREETIVERTEPTEEELIDTPILYSEVGYTKPITYAEAEQSKDELERCVNELNVHISSEMYSETAILAMQKEVERLTSNLEMVQADLNRFETWQAEYPVATEVWFYLRDSGVSEEVTAGIIGNMMAECGGLTLKLVPDIYGKEGNTYYYGLCQWSLYYSPQVDGMSTIQQLDHIMKTIDREFSTFGFCYRKGFTYDDFLNLRSPEEAALAFAKVYERCASFSYGVRERAARTAYNYFTGVE